MPTDEGRLTADDLASYVGFGPAADEYVTQCWTEAVSLVTDHCGDAVVPAFILDRAYLETGAALYNRRDAKNGVAQFAAIDGASPVRIARDPMSAVYPLLRPYLPAGLA